MTYCLGLLLEEGLVMIADTRTNAGVDNISTFRKMHIWERPGDRVMGAFFPDWIDGESDPVNTARVPGGRMRRGWWPARCSPSRCTSCAVAAPVV